MLNIIILAAGRGTRMRSTQPKVLHPLAGQPLLSHVVGAAHTLSPEKIIIIDGYGTEQIRRTFSDPSLIWAHQAEQLGTGHAVQQALPFLSDDAAVLILYGDVPLIAAETLQSLLDMPADLTLLTARLNNPKGFGRIVRETQNTICRIVEEKDASEEEKKIREINTGILATNTTLLKTYLPKLTNQNAQQEFYLTDLIEMAIADGKQVQTVLTEDVLSITGVNDRAQLAALERAYQKREAEKWMLSGVHILDPTRIDFRGDCHISADVTLDINVILAGTIQIATGSEIGANCYLKNVTLGENVRIEPNSVIEDAVIDSGATIGPFARIRPGTRIAEKAKVGNFVEIKKSIIGQGSKVSHLSYIGDCQMGDNVNIGAGTITCNYDGVNKFQTIIGNNVFVGSDTQFIAPVTIGDNATIGAGSTITRNAPEDQLTLSRTKQRSIEGWRKPEKVDKA